MKYLNVYIKNWFSKIMKEENTDNVVQFFNPLSKFMMNRLVYHEGYHADRTHNIIWCSWNLTQRVFVGNLAAKLSIRCVTTMLQENS